MKGAAKITVDGIELNDSDLAYVMEKQRFVVLLVVGYGGHDGVNTAKKAVAAAVKLTQDDGSAGTQWGVFDRKKGTFQTMEQSEVDNVEVP